MQDSGVIRDEVLDELHAYYQGPGEFYRSDELLERLCKAVITLAEVEEEKLGSAKMTLKAKPHGTVEINGQR